MNDKRCRSVRLVPDHFGSWREVRCDWAKGHHGTHYSRGFSWAQFAPPTVEKWARVLDAELARLDELLAGVEPMARVRRDGLKVSQPGLTRHGPP